ncbi:MAG: penicillin-binding protein 2 [Candidatus Schekmanbacteria bacterium]|nr:penicillin-binding protein 2 [Candidatus Schekmanbacteria bacterium]
MRAWSARNGSAAADTRQHFPSRRRMTLLAVLWSLGMLAVAAKLVQLQVIEADVLAARARNQHERLIALPARRGDIYDRGLRCLAATVSAPSLYAIPSELGDVQEAARQIAAVLKVDRRKLADRLASSSSFVWLKRKTGKDEAGRILALGLPGVGWLEENLRSYPNGSVAGQVIGFAGVDNVGLEGLELRHDALLTGSQGRALVGRDALQRAFVVGQWLLSEPTAGRDVVASLDVVLQYQTEKALAAAALKEQAVAGTAIVMDVQTGELYAMANYPPFDPNAFSGARPESRRNRAVTDMFEPGSTFKVVAIAAALEAGVVKAETMIDAAGGAIDVGPHTFHDWKTFGNLTVAEVLANSSNVGTIRIAQKAGAEQLYRTIRRFGFGSPTGVDLPGEAAGMLAPPGRWSATSLGAIAIGQEISATLLQSAVAYAAIANGGYLVTPRMTLRALDEGDVAGTLGSPVTARRARADALANLPRAISEPVAHQLQRMLCAVVDDGTGAKAAIAGYSVGGKTGTAQKVDSEGGYSMTRSVASFVGFLPAQAPRVVVAVALDEPRAHRWASSSAAPLFRDVAWHAITRLRIPREPANWQTAGLSGTPVSRFSALGDAPCRPGANGCGG